MARIEASVFVAGGVLLAALGAGCDRFGGSPSDSARPDSAASKGDSSAPTADTSPDTNPRDTSNDTGGTANDALVFAVVGDTRPPNEDDTAHYPTSIITKIWQDVEAESPHPQFAITTGDYMYADPGGNAGQAQLDLYMQARDLYSGPVYPAMGNHECTGWTDSNCGSDNADGITRNYTAFMDTLVAPLGGSKPYFEEHLAAPDGSWTAKVVVIAANAWDAAQASWLESVMAQSTTYTFVVRHEHDYAHTAPGVDPSAAIFGRYPFTLLICGHSHEYAHYASAKEIIVGNGGAPLTSGTNYGYVIVSRKPNGEIGVTAYDYRTHDILDTFAVRADGSRG